VLDRIQRKTAKRPRRSTFTVKRSDRLTLVEEVHMDVSCVHGSVYRVVLWQLAMETAQLMARTMHCSSVPTMIRV